MVDVIVRSDDGNGGVTDPKILLIVSRVTFVDRDSIGENRARGVHGDEQRYGC